MMSPWNQSSDDVVTLESVIWMMSPWEYNAATHSVNALLSVSVIVKAISFVEKAKQVLFQVLHQGGSGVKVTLMSYKIS